MFMANYQYFLILIFFLFFIVDCLCLPYLQSGSLRSSWQIISVFPSLYLFSISLISTLWVSPCCVCKKSGSFRCLWRMISVFPLYVSEPLYCWLSVSALAVFANKVSHSDVHGKLSVFSLSLFSQYLYYWLSLSPLAVFASKVAHSEVHGKLSVFFPLYFPNIFTIDCLCLP